MYPGMTKEKGRPTNKESRQVVQIAAILFDNIIGKEITSFDVLTWPTLNKSLPSFFTELTEITDADLLERAVSFKDGLRDFVRFAGDYPIYTFNADEGVLRQNCDYVQIAFPFMRPFIRIKPKLSNWGINSEEYSSGTLYQAAELTLLGHVHNALHDVRSMAQAVHAFERQTHAKTVKNLDI